MSEGKNKKLKIEKPLAIMQSLFIRVYYMFEGEKRSRCLFKICLDKMIKEV